MDKIGLIFFSFLFFCLLYVCVCFFYLMKECRGSFVLEIDIIFKPVPFQKWKPFEEITELVFLSNRKNSAAWNYLWIMGLLQAWTKSFHIAQALIVWWLQRSLSDFRIDIWSFQMRSSPALVPAWHVFTSKCCVLFVSFILQHIKIIELDDTV